MPISRPRHGQDKTSPCRRRRCEIGKRDSRYFPSHSGDYQVIYHTLRTVNEDSSFNKKANFDPLQNPTANRFQYIVTVNCTWDSETNSYIRSWCKSVLEIAKKCVKYNVLRLLPRFFPLTSNRHHLSYDDCLENKGRLRDCSCCIGSYHCIQCYAHIL